MPTDGTNAGAAAVHVLYGETMGTRWRVNAVAPPGADLHAMHAVVQAPLDQVVAQMSTWEPASDLCRYNRADAGSWQRLPQPLFDVVRCALAVARESAGAFDPTIGALVRLWGFGAGGDPGRAPPDDAVRARLADAGWRRVALDDDAHAAWQPGGIALDLSAIAKGYGVDAVIAALRARGVRAALVEVGGELRAYGRKPDGTAWRILVEAGDDGDAIAPCVLALEDAAVATSGDRWHRFEADGRTYAHTIDPRSGRPVEHAPVSVTVVAEDAMRADAWATALTVLGADAGFAFARARGFAARFATRADAGAEVRETPEFQRWRCA